MMALTHASEADRLAGKLSWQLIAGGISESEPVVNWAGQHTFSQIVSTPKIKNGSGIFDAELQVGPGGVLHASLVNFANQKHVSFGFLGGDGGTPGVSIVANGCFAITNTTSNSHGTRDLKLSRDASGPVWAIRANGGARIRNFSNTSDAPLSASDATFSGMVSPGPSTFATLPSASANSGAQLRITDRSQKVAYSDGSNWRFISNDAVVS